MVAIDSRARAAFPWLPPSAPARAVLVGPDGTTVIVTESGTVDLALPGGHPRPGIASDPCAGKANE